MVQGLVLKKSRQATTITPRCNNAILDYLRVVADFACLSCLALLLWPRWLQLASLDSFSDTFTLVANNIPPYRLRVE